MAGLMVDGQPALTLPPASLSAGARLHLHCWLPMGAISGVILLSHGYGEHGGRYTDFAARLTDHGYAVYAIDHWGHGLSDGQGGFIPDFTVFTDGLSALLDHVKAQHPQHPRFLVGHSMGGLIAAHFLIDHQTEFRAVALSGPALAPARKASALLRGISKILSRIAPKLGVMKLDASSISRDAAIVAAYRADPLVYKGPIGARLVHEMLGAMADVQHSAPQIRVPMLIQHGASDQLTAPAASERYFLALGSPDKEIQLYEGLFHEIYNEPEKTAVIADLIGWFDRHTAS